MYCHVTQEIGELSLLCSLTDCRISPAAGAPGPGPLASPRGASREKDSEDDLEERLRRTIFPGREERGEGRGASSAGEVPMHGAPLTTRESREAPTSTPVFLRAPTFSRDTLVMAHCSLLITPGSCRMPHESRRMSPAA